MKRGPSVELNEIISVLAGGVSGGVLVKIGQMWLKHRQEVDGDFEERTKASQSNFSLVVKHLENRIKHLEESEKQCIERNMSLQRQVNALENRISNMLLRSPWREMTDFGTDDHGVSG